MEPNVFLSWFKNFMDDVKATVSGPSLFTATSAPQGGLTDTINSVLWRIKLIKTGIHTKCFDLNAELKLGRTLFHVRKFNLSFHPFDRLFNIKV